MFNPKMESSHFFVTPSPHSRYYTLSIMRHVPKSQLWGSQQMLNVAIVIPCYNEANRLDSSKFKDFASHGHNVRFLFVNDGSTDNTLEVLESLRESDPRIFSVCRLTKNSGKAEAVRQGFLAAFESNSDYVGFWDADLATPLDTIVSFCQLLDDRRDIEMVFGSRVWLLGRTIERKAWRHYLGRVFATTVSLVLGLNVYDTQCGAKLFRVSPTLMALFREAFITKWIFDVEIIARLIQMRRETNLPAVEDIIYEYPLLEWRDVGGSKVTAIAFIKAIFELLSIYLKYLRE